MYVELYLYIHNAHKKLIYIYIYINVCIYQTPQFSYVTWTCLIPIKLLLILFFSGPIFQHSPLFLGSKIIDSTVPNVDGCHFSRRGLYDIPPGKSGHVWDKIFVEGLLKSKDQQQRNLICCTCSHEWPQKTTRTIQFNKEYLIKLLSEVVSGAISPNCNQWGYEVGIPWCTTFNVTTCNITTLATCRQCEPIYQQESNKTIKSDEWNHPSHLFHPQFSDIPFQFAHPTWCWCPLSPPCAPTSSSMRTWDSWRAHVV